MLKIVIYSNKVKEEASTEEGARNSQFKFISLQAQHSNDGFF
jgi:hypothetical protein